MRHVFRWLLYLLLLAAAGLVIYAYAGPYFGADFSPPQTEIREPVTLDVD